LSAAAAGDAEAVGETLGIAGDRVGVAVEVEVGATAEAVTPEKPGCDVTEVVVAVVKKLVAEAATTAVS
jgi:hypothetical protein